MTHPKKAPDAFSGRRTYIDWLRGIAVLCMVEWHAVDAWTLTSERDGTAFTVLAYLGGWAAPLFLFLAGLAIPLAAESNIRKGLSVREAAWALQKRGWQILLLAHLFRLQSYLLNPYAVWHGLFKPDILNILGLGMVATAFCWGRAETLRGRLVWVLTPAMLALALTTLARGWWWPTLLHPRFEANIRPNGGFGQFALFPWTTYVFLGAALGLWITMQRTPEADRRFHGYLAGVGLLLVAAGSLLWPPWSGVVSRTGGMIVALVVAWLWMQRPGAARWSPIVVFGQTSLFVYWVHVELAYGQFTRALKRGLTVPEALFAYAVFIALLLWAAHAWKKRKEPWIPSHLTVPAAALLIAVSLPTMLSAHDRNSGARLLSLSGPAPGNYTLRSGTPDLPQGRPFDFIIRADAIMEVVPRLPATITEFRISGLVTLNGKPRCHHRARSRCLPCARGGGPRLRTSGGAAGGRARRNRHRPRPRGCQCAPGSSGEWRHSSEPGHLRE